MDEEHGPALDRLGKVEARPWRHRRMPRQLVPALPCREALHEAPGLEQAHRPVEPKLRLRIEGDGIVVRGLSLGEAPLGGERLAQVAPGRGVAGLRRGGGLETGDGARHIPQLGEQGTELRIVRAQGGHGTDGSGGVIEPPAPLQDAGEVAHRMGVVRPDARHRVEQGRRLPEPAHCSEAERVEQGRLDVALALHIRPGEAGRLVKPARVQRRESRPQRRAPDGVL